MPSTMMRLFSLLVLSSLVSISTQQKDPLKDFCRLFGHQTSVVDRKLYIDGGLVNWSPISETSSNYSSTWMKNADFDIDHEGFPEQFTLAKNETVPTVQGGILWADEANKLVYMYGGEYGNGKPEDFRLWYYDIVYNTWNITTASTTDIRRASWGAGAVAQDKAQAYYYGGWLTSASVPGYNSQTPLSTMLIYNMLDGSFRNQSGPDSTRRAEGVMQYVPAGDSGMLVYFGGLQFSEGNFTGKAMNMSEILVYSIADDKWYTETASGQVPPARRRFCAGVAWAEDRSSYNIYLYGGASVGKGAGFADVYVLSLPSFTWIKFWPRPEDDEGTVAPHHSLTCNVIGNSQMIIMGGTFPNTTGCDIPANYGQHGLDLGKANSEGAAWARFNPNLTTYQVPTEIAMTIGGEKTGGATVLAPTAGWRERDLSVQFARAYTPATRGPTRYIPTATGTTEPSSDGGRKKAIIGGAVGGGIGAIIIIALIAFCVLRRRKNAKNDTDHAASNLPSEQKSPQFPTPPMPFYKPATTRDPNTPHTATESEWAHWRHPTPAPSYAGHSPHSPSPSDMYSKSYSPPEPQLHELPATATWAPQEMDARDTGLAFANPNSNVSPASKQEMHDDPVHPRRETWEEIRHRSVSPR